MPRTTTPCLLAAAALVALAGAAEAATAYNSQRGSLGHDKNVCQATAYFPAGGCLSSFVASGGRDLFDQPLAAYRPGHRLTYPDGTLPYPGR